MNRRAISKMLGVKLLPVSGEMTRSAKDMLDTEMEYIDYLRNRRKFFVMTNLQQTRVITGRKKKDRDADGKSKISSSLGRLRFKKPRRIRWKNFGKNSKVGRIIRNVRAGALRLGGAPSLGKKPVYKGWMKIFNPRNITRLKNKIGDMATGAGKNIKKFGKNLVVGTVDNLKKLKNLWKGRKVIVDRAKALVKGIMESPLAKRLSKVIGKGAGRAVPVVSMALSANDIARYEKIGGWKGQVGMFLASLDLAADGTTLISGPLAATGWGAAVPGIAQIVSQIAGWGLTGFELVQVLMGQDPYAAFNEETQSYDGPSTDGMFKFSEGGEVTRPTKALIGEGGEGELVIPHSKMGKVMSSLFKEVGAMMLGITKGFLTTLPTPSTESDKLLQEASVLSGLFPGGEVPKIFSGKKIKDKLAGLTKKAITVTNPIAGLITNILTRPVNAQTNVLEGNTIITNTSSSSNTTIAGDRTMVSNFNITDYYGSTENRTRPHGGVDVGTPVGTPVGFAEDGEVIAAGRYGGYGNMMDVWLPNTGIQMRIAHLSSFVKKSGKFLAGEVLAKTGGAKGDPGAGNSTGPHLHFEFDNIKDSTRYGGAGDPLPYAPLIKLGNFEPPSTDATGGPSYGYPLVNTVKWPSSNGAMGGASFSPSKASGLTPNEGSITSTITKPLIAFLPIPIATPVAVPVNKIIMKKVERKPVYGINPLSGKYGEI